ncbi:MAG TPA: alpha/beta fold hydrolase [Gemmataceae bacterium]|jgi:poly(3-hydroxybutyrate) depolymerase
MTTRLPSRLALTAAAALLIPAAAVAAEPAIDRYDLGQRLVLVERAWASQHDAAARGRAVPVLKQAVPQFLANKNVEAAETLDRARLLLRSADPSPADRWAAALLVHPATRLLDPAHGSLAVHVLSAYPAGSPPAGAVLRLALVGASGAAPFAAAEVPLAALPAAATLPTDKLPEGDHTLRAEVVVGGQVLATYTAGVSAVPRLAKRIGSIHTAAGKALDRSTDSATLQSLAVLLEELYRRNSPETNYPAARLVAEAEALARARAAKEEFYGPKRTGQFWLTLPANKDGVPVRLFVPEQARAGKPLPLVVALHGAGGSENLFFDAYGSGLIARLAAERGWLVVAPRAGWLFDGPPPVAAIVDELAKLYPVDQKRVYVVGHSMGAMQSVAVAQDTPGRFAAIAPLGGGGTVRKPEVFAELPVFVGYGTEDFLAGGERGLAAALRESGAKKLTVKEYAGVEHILVVQEALPDVFRFFEKAGSGSERRR